MTPIEETIQVTCQRMLEIVQEKKEITSWQLKLLLQISSSVLYICLGVLYNQKQIRLEADGINYKISLPGPDNPQTNPF